MKRSHHEIWITNQGDNLFVSFTNHPEQTLDELRYKNFRKITPASRERLNRIIKRVPPTNVYLHPEGPSLTYKVDRGVAFPPPRPAITLAQAA